MTDFLARAHALANDLVAWRRDFHRHPELGFQEVRTAGIVADHLRRLGIETTTGVGRTGVVGLIEGSGPGPTVLLRFDMDALPITEATGLPFASQNPGVMHACGHDGHTAIGVGVAALLSKTVSHWPGRVKLLFQPAEEGLGGAKATIDDGALRDPKPDVAFGLHLWNQMPKGQVAVQAGPLMAAADRFRITITGRGGHGALPHETIDAILVATQAANALYAIVGRNISPHDAAVLSLGSFQSGDAFNIIPERAELTGTLRTFRSEVRDLLIERMKAVLAGITQAHGAQFEMEFGDHTPAVINDAAAARTADRAARRLLGDAPVGAIMPLMVAEDMAEILNRIPGCYLLLGAHPAEAEPGPHHNPRFDFDEAMLPVAAALLTSIAVDFLCERKT